jgi:XTP/dITP diphosphohydrolase
MTQLLIGTSNKGKVMEIEEALHELSCEIVTPASCGIFESPAEHGDTFEANALEKARFYFEKTRIATLADDSGIIVEALVNELGIHTRRWGAGPSASDEEWITYFLERMRSGFIAWDRAER